MISSSQRALVIESYAPLRELFSIVLTNLGFEVRATSDGHDGASLVMAWRPRLLLLEPATPGLDGLALRQACLETGPAVIVTSWDQRLRSWSIDYGAVAMLAKPFDLQQLVAVLDELDIP